MKVFHYLLLFITAFCVRAAFWYLAPAQYQSFGDTEEYLEAAKRICSTGTYPFEHIFLPTFRAPGFPVFLAAISGCLSLPSGDIALILMLLDSLSCITGMAVVANLSRTSNKTRSLIFGLAYSAYPLFIQQSITIQSECLTVFLIFSGIYFIVRASERSSSASLIYGLSAGAVFGYAVLTRPSALMLAFPVVAGIFLGNQKYKKIFLSVFSGAALTVLPWSFYASQHTGRLTLVNDSFCYSIYRGARLELLDVYSAVNAESFRLASEKSEAAVREAERNIGAKSWCSETLNLLRDNPSQQFELAVTKFIAFFRPWPHAAAHNFFVVAIVGCITSLLYAIYLINLLQKSHNTGLRTAKWVVTLYILLIGLFHVPHQVSNRYRVPFADPVMLIAACAYLNLQRRTSQKPCLAG